MGLSSLNLSATAGRITSNYYIVYCDSRHGVHKNAAAVLIGFTLFTPNLATCLGTCYIIRIHTSN